MQTTAHSDLTDNQLRDRIASRDAKYLRLSCGRDLTNPAQKNRMAGLFTERAELRAELARREEADASLKVAAQ